VFAGLLLGLRLGTEGGGSAGLLLFLGVDAFGVGLPSLFLGVLGRLVGTRGTPGIDVGPVGGGGCFGGDEALAGEGSCCLC